MRFNGRIMRTVLRYPETLRAEETWRDLGRPSTTIEEFARTIKRLRPSSTGSM
jgi:hypothetical protein